MSGSSKANAFDENDTPQCSGIWISGSGGHRKHEPCSNLAHWFDGDDMWAYCDAHCSNQDKLAFFKHAQRRVAELEGQKR